MMTRVRVASVLVAVVAGDYALLTLVNGRLTDFGVTAGIWVGCSTAAGLIAYASKRRRQAMARGRAAVWQRRDRQAATAGGQQCPSCGDARQLPSDSPRFADRQRTRLCGVCAPGSHPRVDTTSPGRSRRNHHVKSVGGVGQPISRARKR